MNNSNKVILELLKAFIHNTRPECDFIKIDWVEVKEISDAHAISSIIFEEIRKLYIDLHIFDISNELKLDWFSLQQKILKQNKRIDDVQKIIFRTLSEAKIPVILLKGSALAHEYENPNLRMGGDIDLFVGRVNYERAKKIFRSKGILTNRSYHEDIKHLGFKLYGVEVELHRYAILIPGRKQNEYLQKCLEETLEHSEIGYYSEDVFIKTLPPLENLIFTFAHMFRHFMSEGVGLKQLIDIAILVKKNWKEESANNKCERLFKILAKTDLLKAWSIFGYLNIKYIGFSEYNYPCIDKKYKKYADKIIEIVMEDGNFGNRHRFKKKIKSSFFNYLLLLKSHMRLFKLFPKESIRYINRQIYNTSEKYYSRLLKLQKAFLKT